MHHPHFALQDNGSIQRAALLVAFDIGDVQSSSCNSTLELFSRFLHHCGYTMVTFMCTSAKAKEQRPTRDHILSAVEKLVSMLKKNDLLMVYVVGRGERVQSGDQLLPALLPLGCSDNQVEMGALFIVDLQDALCSESEDEDKQPNVLMVLDVISLEPLWDEEQLKVFTTDIPEVAWICHTHRIDPAEPRSHHFFSAFASSFQGLLGSPGNATHGDLCEAIQGELVSQAESLQAAAGSIFDTVQLVEGTEIPSYMYILVCSVPVAVTKQKDCQQEMAAELHEALGCMGTEFFAVMLDIIFRLQPAEEVRVSALMPCVQQLAHHCRGLGLEVPELKRVRLRAQDIASMPTSTALISPQETADLTFSLTVNHGDAMRDKLLLKGNRVWTKLFPGFSVLEVRSTFQVRATGPLPSYIKALSHMASTSLLGHVRIEAMWMVMEPGPPAGLLANHASPSEWLFEHSPLKALALSTSTHPDAEDEEPLVEDSSFENSYLNGDAQAGAALEDGAVVFRATGHSYWVSCADFSSDDHLLATGGWDCALRIWAMPDGALSATFERAHGGWITSLCFGRPLRKKSIIRQRLINTFRGNATESFIAGHAADREEAGPTPMGNQKASSSAEYLLASGAMDGSLVIWNTEEGTAVHRVQAHDRGVTAVAFSRSSTVLASACEDGSVRCWTVASGTCVGNLKGHRGCVSSLVFGAQREDFLATASFDGMIFFWTLLGTEESQPPKTSRAHVAFDGAVPPLQLTDRQMSNPLTPNRQESKVMDRAFSWVTDSAMRVPSQCDVPGVDLSESRIQHRLEGHREPILCLAMSRNDETLASGSQSGQVLVWSVPKRFILLTLKGHQEAITSLSFSISTKLLASSSRDGKVHIWAMPYAGIVDKSAEGQRPVATIPYSATGKAAFACKFGSSHNALVVTGQDCSAVVYAWDQGGRHLPAPTTPTTLRLQPRPVAQSRSAGPDWPRSDLPMALMENWECGWNWPEGLEPYAKGAEEDWDTTPGPHALPGMSAAELEENVILNHMEEEEQTQATEEAEGNDRRSSVPSVDDPGKCPDSTGDSPPAMPCGPSIGPSDAPDD
eukprot:GGOE01037844.1.p1 GENE.GGOE01037844.1~~GGOE01037844.1.p1  ORF type:complete len:1078 (+),score=197.51 GGOE01037844.1:91-3324(+)